MHDCWHEQPSQRPSFEVIAQRLRVLRRGVGSRQGSANLGSKPSASSQEGRRSNDVSFSAPSDDAMRLQPSLNDMLTLRGQGTSSGEKGGAGAGPPASPIKFSLQPADPQRLFSGGAVSDEDVAGALSVVKSTAAAAAAVELTLSQDEHAAGEAPWKPQLGGLPEGERGEAEARPVESPREVAEPEEHSEEPQGKPKKTWSKFLKGRRSD